MLFQKPPRSGPVGGARRNPERASRRQTRSMAGWEEPREAEPRDPEAELSLEDELLEVTHTLLFDLFYFSFLYRNLNIETKVLIGNTSLSKCSCWQY